MKANELRIGNLVKCSITGLIDECDSDYIHDLYGGGISIEEIEPIPLNEEWLFKFGAVKRFASQWDYHLSIGAIKIYFRFNVKWYCELEGIYLDSKIQYVHQLQNLYFAITGYELEFKP